MHPMGGQAECSRWLRLSAAAVVVGCLILGELALAQPSFRFYGMPPRFPEGRPNGKYVFTRVLYDQVRGEPGGQGWSTDYPAADVNFMIRLSELTTATVDMDKHDEPKHVVVLLTDPRLFNYPFIFMSDVGTIGLSDLEAERLRTYLLKGGFLWVDDFWGTWAWAQWEREISRVLAPGEYPIFDVPLDHPIFTMMHTITRIPQIPSIQHWRRSGGDTTSERGHDSAEPHFRGIADEHGRLMVVMSHNTDIADGWEREGEEYEYFYRFSPEAYSFGFNVAIYSMTH